MVKRGKATKTKSRNIHTLTTGPHVSLKISRFSLGQFLGPKFPFPLKFTPSVNNFKTGRVCFVLKSDFSLVFIGSIKRWLVVLPP